ncbi:putative GATA zinc finger [Lyophyllum shimeji]|uniref:GATA zinc finger n=1 Tax=Lyophyllum shimeji TaxID=47721 RepID=A0A9P3PUK1_LYOSH|nr:putative GATA zinc finger [Lyophyllum shimeji]
MSFVFDLRDQCFHQEGEAKPVTVTGQQEGSGGRGYAHTAMTKEKWIDHLRKLEQMIMMDGLHGGGIHLDPVVQSGACGDKGGRPKVPVIRGDGIECPTERCERRLKKLLVPRGTRLNQVLSDSPINITPHSSPAMPTYSWDSHRTTKETDKEHDPPQNGNQPDNKPSAPDASTDDAPAKPDEQHDATKPVEPTRPNFPSHFDSDKKDAPTFNFSTLSERSNGAAPASMPHRVEPYPMTSSHRRHYEYDHRHRPSPPPISTLTHSPTPSVSSLDRSSVSTPPVRRSPPHGMPAPPPPPPHLYASPYPPDPAMMNRHFRPDHPHLHHGYMYAPPPPHPYPHDPQQDMPQGSPYHGSAAIPPHMVPMRADHHHPHHAYGAPPPPAPSHAHAYPGQQAGLAIVHTDDAATKLSDRVRRRCFNCCTTDTSTWRRSNLSPGKVLCNKCGLFERTHSRPRPEQFPHKRGPLSTSTLRARTPPQTQTQTQLPPISTPTTSFHYSHPPPPPPPHHLVHQHQHPQQQHSQHPQQDHHQQQQQQHDTTHREYTHTHAHAHTHQPPSSSSNEGGNGNGNGNTGGGTTLPALQTWHHESGQQDVPPREGKGSGSGSGSASKAGSRQASPPPPPAPSRPGSAHQKQEGELQQAAAAA